MTAPPAEGEQQAMVAGDRQKKSGKGDSGCYAPEWCCSEEQLQSTAREWQRPFFSLSLKLSAGSRADPRPPAEADGVLRRHQAPPWGGQGLF